VLYTPKLYASSATGYTFAEAIAVSS